MMTRHFQLNKVTFNPSTSFIANLWNSYFFWILPDSPSGVSIFFCPETKSLNATELEKERNFALADKVKAGEIEKLSKQKLHLPNTIMDMIWMIHNLYAVISLCFGKTAHSASFLKDWSDHMCKKHLMYTCLHASDPYFFAIDNALQIHWRSCSTTNDRSPSMTECGKHNGRQGRSNNYHQFKPDIITDNDKNHTIWRIKEGEVFAKTFYKNQKQCPKTHDGKSICMKFFIQGFCDKTCTCVHKLSPDEEKSFNHFITSCREDSSKPDF